MLCKVLQGLGAQGHGYRFFMFGESDLSEHLKVTWVSIVELGAPTSDDLRLIGAGPLGVVHRAGRWLRKRLIHLGPEQLERVRSALSHQPEHPNLGVVTLERTPEGYLAWTPWVDALAGFTRGTAAQVLSGLAALHQAGTFHGHLAPENIRRLEDGTVLIVDAGLWCAPVAEGPRAGPWQRLAAPERLEGESPTCAGDCYAFGRLLIERGDENLRDIAEALCALVPGERLTAAEALVALNRLSPSARRPRIGPYSVARTLGQGGMGVVYLATRGDQVVALKTVTTHHPGIRQALREEYRCLAELSHPGVARLLDHGEHEGAPWYAMALVRGEPLGSHLERTHSDRERLSLMAKLCDTLAFLHGEGLVHGDLKPENVLVADGDQPVLVDFGLAMRADPGGTREEVSVRRGVAGSAAYMAPEQTRRGVLDARADLYAVGCMLYEAWCGSPPFTGGTVREIIRAHRTTPPMPMAHRDADLPAGLSDLVQRLLAKDPLERPGYAAEIAFQLRTFAGEIVDVPPAPSWVYRAPFLGREAQRQQIHELLEQPTPVIGLAGASGIGKTRLALAIAADLEDAGHRVHTLDGRVRGPLGVFRDLLRRTADRLEAGELPPDVLGSGRSPLAVFEPRLGEVPEGRDLVPTELVSALLRVLCEDPDRPVTLILDDVQELGQWARVFLDHVLQERVSTHLRVIVCWRSEGGVPSGLADVPTVWLGPLEPDAVGALAAGMLAAPETPEAFAVALADLSCGNPFFVGEVLRAAVEQGLLTRRGGAWDLEVALGELRLPGRIDDLLRARLGTLPEAASTVLEAAAVLRPFPTLAALIALAPMERYRFDMAMRSLGRAAVLEPKASGGWVFRHPRLRQLAYQGTPSEHRRRLHSAAAGLIGQDAALVADHWLAAEETGHAFDAYVRAARERIAVSAHRDALALFERALALDVEPTLEVRYETAAFGLARVGRLEEADRALRALLELAEDRSNPVLVARIRARLVSVLLEMGDLVGAKILVPQAVSEVRAHADDEYASMLGMAGRVHAQLGESDRARVLYDEALADAGSRGNLREEAIMLSRLAGLEWGRNLERAAALEARALVLIRGLGDRFFEGIILGNLASVRHLMGAEEDAVVLLEQAAAIHREVGNDRSLALTTQNLGEVWLDRGDLNQARSMLETALGVARRCRSRIQEAGCLTMLGRVALEQADLDRSGVLLRQAIDIQEAAGMNKWLTETLRLESRRLCARGELEEAVRIATRSLSLAEDQGDPVDEVPALCALARAKRLSGRPDGALLDKARVLDRHPTPATLAALAELSVPE